MKHAAEQLADLVAPELPVDPADEESPLGSDSIGDYLARQRKLRGVSLEELSTRTRIPRRSLERMESGAFDGQLDGFVRGFVRTVAIDLGLDPDDAIMRMQSEPAPPVRRTRPLGPGPRQLLLMFFLALIVLAAGGLMRALVLSTTSNAPAEGVVMRRDPVRALAEAQLDALAAPQVEEPGHGPTARVEAAAH